MHAMWITNDQVLIKERRDSTSPGKLSPFLRTEPRIALNMAKCPLTRGLVRNNARLPRERLTAPIGEAHASYKEVSKYTWTGSCLPFRCNVPIGVVTASCSRALVSGPIATPPIGAVLSMREAMLTVSPTIV
jgi:hypothetical protein